jgi:ornithine cyclodeaminase/alanine dehydrogenase-like protein (mu-crystallin family)
LAWFVGRNDVERLFADGHVPIAGCIDAVEAAFREHGRDQVGILPRQILTADGAAPQPRSRALKLSASYMRESRLMGASIYSTHFRPGDVDMWLMVFSGQSGDLEGILHGKALSLWKTGATAAVATRHMARRMRERAAIIGTGVYAKAQLQCIGRRARVDRHRVLQPRCRTPAGLRRVGRRAAPAARVSGAHRHGRRSKAPTSS